MSTSLLPTNFGQEKSSTVLEDLYKETVVLSKQFIIHINKVKGEKK